ncbi:MAG: hypothetical protein HY920_02805 [Elusimicrobia bacterium]|nr:hypothetical protein [Elusimicrobiota bacterium]
MIKFIIYQEKGISLIEIAVAMLILCLVGLCIPNMLLQGNKNTITFGYIQEAVNQAYTGMELLKSIPYNNLPPAGAYAIGGAIPVVLSPIIKSVSIGTNRLADRSVVIKDIDDPDGGGTQDYKEVNVIVTWPERGRQLNKTLTSYMSPR